VFKPNDTPALNYYPTVDSSFDIPDQRNDYGVAIISNAKAGATMYRLR